MKSVILIFSILFAINISAQEIRIDTTNNGKVNSISIIEATDSVIYSQTFVMKESGVKKSRDEAQLILIKIRNEVKTDLPNSNDEGEETEVVEGENVTDNLKAELEREKNILEQFERNVEEWKIKVKNLQAEIKEGRIEKRKKLKAINEAIKQLK